MKDVMIGLSFLSGGCVLRAANMSRKLKVDPQRMSHSTYLYWLCGTSLDYCLSRLNMS